MTAAALVADYCRQDHLGSAMGTFGTIFDVGHAAGPLLAGTLIGLWGGAKTWSWWYDNDVRGGGNEDRSKAPWSSSSRGCSSRTRGSGPISWRGTRF